MPIPMQAAQAPTNLPGQAPIPMNSRPIGAQTAGAPQQANPQARIAQIVASVNSIKDIIAFAQQLIHSQDPKAQQIGAAIVKQVQTEQQQGKPENTIVAEFKQGMSGQGAPAQQPLQAGPQGVPAR